MSHKLLFILFINFLIVLLSCSIGNQYTFYILVEHDFVSMNPFTWFLLDDLMAVLVDILLLGKLI